MHTHPTEFVRAFSKALEASSGPNGDGRMRLTVTFNVGDEAAAFAAVSSLIAERSETAPPSPAPDWRDALEAGDSPDTAGSRTYTNRHVAAMIREALGGAV